jgi:AcrR family transcriptional regulator
MAHNRRAPTAVTARGSHLAVAPSDTRAVAPGNRLAFARGNGVAVAPGGPVVEDPRRSIVALQRARLLRAVAETCAEHGAANLTVGHIVERSGVSRRTFYEAFSGREDCLLAAVDQALGRLGERVIPVYRTPGRWVDRMRAAVLEALEFFDEEPYIARLLLVETLGSGERVLRLRQSVLVEIIAALDEARSQTKSAVNPPPLAAEGALGGALAVLHARLLDAEHKPLVELTGQLMSILVLPYLGASAARRELTRPLPQGVTRKPPPANPLHSLDMRLTYRTVRVLLAVANHPSASNTELALAAGIHDQGQASKLLTRLERLGLIENAGAGIRRGAANAWTLTQTGAKIQQAINAQNQPSHT